jgi:hypothetical protein
MIKVRKEDLESARKEWAEIAKLNRAYHEPFFVKVWIDRRGNIHDSVGYSGLKKDTFIHYKSEAEFKRIRLI